MRPPPRHRDGAPCYLVTVGVLFFHPAGWKPSPANYRPAAAVLVSPGASAALPLWYARCPATVTGFHATSSLWASSFSILPPRRRDGNPTWCSAIYRSAAAVLVSPGASAAVSVCLGGSVIPLELRALARNRCYSDTAFNKRTAPRSIKQGDAASRLCISPVLADRRLPIQHHPPNL